MALLAGRNPEELTFGLEEEFVLVDSREPVSVPRAQALLARIGDRGEGRVQPEFYQTQIETSTLPHKTTDELRVDLVQVRRQAADAAAGVGARLVASAAGVLTSRPMQITESPRYLKIARNFPHVVAEIESESSGCHVHVGPLSRDEAVLLGTRVRPWLPLLQAIAANSPFAAGRDRHCASWRFFEFQRWPTVGPAPVLDGPGYEQVARRLTESGTILDRKMIYWFSRPSERWPTLEIRVADVNPDPHVPLLIAVLLRGLVMTLLGELRAGRPVPGSDDHRLVQDHRLAAQLGLDAEGLDPLTGSVEPVSERLASLLEFSRPGLQMGYDVETACALRAAVSATAGGVGQQRADFRVRGSLADVVNGLAERTAL
ncbi:MAG: YbdK family carboxylate-amine ligase [Catenulispora sp.]|nr:YbdK family carboxylate-amine ligase [Catenulispora sp.]